MAFLVVFPLSLHANTCNTPGYYLDNNDECKECSTVIFSNNDSAYCPGDGKKYLCPRLSESDNLSHLWRYYTWATDNISRSIGGCRIGLKNYPINHGVLAFSTNFAPSRLLDYYAIDWQSAGYDSANDYFVENWDENIPIDYGYMAHDKTYQVEYTMSHCDSGYYGGQGNKYYTFSSYESMFEYEHCVPVGHGYYSPQNSWSRTACPIGTYTRNNTSLSADDCLPCTNKPNNATYTAADTTGVNNCPWSCDVGYGRHGNECLPLCNTGITKLNTSTGLVYNIYAEKHTIPAIHIRWNNAVCYVNLELGNKKNAINIRYGATIYHVTD